MKKDKRSDIKKAKDAVYASLPVALIQKPLRLINLKTGEESTKGWSVSRLYTMAYKAAKLGNGAVVKQIARNLI